MFFRHEGRDCVVKKEFGEAIPGAKRLPFIGYRGYTVFRGTAHRTDLQDSVQDCRAQLRAMLDEMLAAEQEALP